jgi:polyferredoxin
VVGHVSAQARQLRSTNDTGLLIACFIPKESDNSNKLSIYMDTDSLYLLAADALLIIHVLFVIFIIGSLVLIFIGKLRDWKWVRWPLFRIIHLIGIGVVVGQTWLGLICPLTIWEMSLRELAGEDVYAGSFISHWLSSLLYYRAPQWVFTTVYTAFGLLVAASWIWVRPYPLSKS